ncbi:hypothetical protein AVEN_225293-1 [Araneus ventricosus]|uniref:Uncharacterized protein n=1 Tax=Araneus ventricosus TaxID=182803 RepID=A0A4Y2AMZ5_ARAVE|nr:hypothetical protein AVEN_225293-1 [Araneus ventricosus]
MGSLKVFLNVKRNDLVEEALQFAKDACEEMGIPVVKRTARRKKIMPGKKAADEPLTLDQQLKSSLLECIDWFQQEIDTRCEGFSENKSSSETEEVDSIKHSIGEINPEKWASIQKDYNTNISFEDFLDVDNELQTCGTMTDKDIVPNINAEISDEEKEELDQQEKLP